MYRNKSRWRPWLALAKESQTEDEVAAKGWRYLASPFLVKRRLPVCLFAQLFAGVLLQPIPMRIERHDAQAVVIRPMPAVCDTGKRCLQPSGALRAGPHVDRRLSAIEAVEMKRDHVLTAGPTSDTASS